MSRLRLTSALFAVPVASVLAGLSMPVIGASEQMPTPIGSRTATSAAVPVGRSSAGAESAAASPATAASAHLDPMERLRLRLAERLAASASRGERSGTFDLQAGTRAGTGAARAAAKAGAPGTGGSQASAAPGAPAGSAKAAAPSAEDIDSGHAEGIAWSRPAAVRAPHRVSVPAAPAKTRAVPAAMAAVPSNAATPNAPAVPTHRAAAAATVRTVAAPAASGEHAASHWGHEGATGPAAWGGMRPEFSLCATGQRQSPIDLSGGFAVDLEPVRFDYRPSAFAVIDNGHTVQVNLAPGNTIEAGGRRFELVQFHFHRPSEERIDGRQFEMSLHLVHRDGSGRLAVVAVLLGRGPAHPVVQAVWNNLPLERHEEVAARGQLDPTHLLPEDRRYFTYMGSLTTPPCSEGVLWVVLRTPVTATAEQMELFARLYPMNARPAQPIAGRRILQSR